MKVITKSFILGLALILLGATVGSQAEEKEQSDDMEAAGPSIGVGFDDDASSLVISTTWKEDGKELKEAYSFGKDIHLTFEKIEGEWKRAEGFRSKNWEAYLIPDGNGFILMEREYEDKKFENISLRIFEYVGKRTVRYLRPSNGSPYWGPDSQKVAMVEKEKNGKYNITIYNIHKGSVIKVKRGLKESKAEKMLKGYLRARVCDDELPCDPAENLELIKERKRKRGL